MINRYCPSRETPQWWGACPCSSDPRLRIGGCCVVSWTCMLQHGDSNTPPNTPLYITCRTSLTCAAPQKIRLGPCICWNDVYVKKSSFYNWRPTELLYTHRSMFWIFGCFDIVTNIFFHAFCMLYHVWLYSCHPCNITLLFSSL